MGPQFNKNPFNNNRGPGAIMLLLILGVGLAYLFWYNSSFKSREVIPLSTFLTQVDAENVKSLAVQDQHVQGEFKRPIIYDREGKIKRVTLFETVVTSLDPILTKLYNQKVEIVVYPKESHSLWPHVIFIILFGLVGLVMYLFFRQAQGGGGSKIFNVGKSKARLFSPNTIKIKFKDVAGVQEAKDDLRDIVDFLKSPEKFKKIGAKIPRGILLTGAPGNGKTMLAKAVAGEANVPYFSVNGSDFVEVFVGVGASRVRDLFLQARRYAPCIIFIDEIDAVGRHRGTGVGSGNEEREQTLNQLLSEMDGFATEEGQVIVLAATNRVDVLDKALLRPGRFDRKVEVPYPDLVSREQILRIHTGKVMLGLDVDLKKIARGTAQFSGADLANLVNEAALGASKKGRESVSMDDFEEARDKIIVGAERSTLSRTEEEMKRTAFHEAGHTLVSVLTPNTYPLHKVTILSRGGALGITWYLPEGDQVSRNEIEMKSEIMVCLGGRVAEELVYGIAQRTTGAYSDLKAATSIAKDMVMRFGMSPLGPMTISEQPGHKEYSESTAQKIDEYIRAILDECYQATVDLLTQNREKLDLLATTLFDKETMDAQEVYTLLDLPPRVSYSFNKEGGLTEELPLETPSTNAMGGGEKEEDVEAAQGTLDDE